MALLPLLCTICLTSSLSCWHLMLYQIIACWVPLSTWKSLLFSSAELLAIQILIKPIRRYLCKDISSHCTKKITSQECGHPAFPALFVEDDFFSPAYGFEFVINHTRFVWEICIQFSINTSMAECVLCMSLLKIYFS